MTGATIECNNCITNCNRKESKHRTKFFEIYFPSCKAYSKPEPFKRPMVEMAMFSELMIFGEIRHVSKIKSTVWEGV